MKISAVTARAPPPIDMMAHTTTRGDVTDTVMDSGGEVGYTSHAISSAAMRASLKVWSAGHTEIAPVPAVIVVGLAVIQAVINDRGYRAFVTPFYLAAETNIAVAAPSFVTIIKKELASVVAHDTCFDFVTTRDKALTLGASFFAQ